MSENSTLLNRGRGSALLLTGALFIFFIGGWLKQLLLGAMRDPILAIPWIFLRRIVFGLLIDVPMAVILVLTCYVAGKILVLTPFRTPALLVGTLLVFELISTWLVLDNFMMVSDPIVDVSRIIVWGCAFFGGAMALGWKPRRKNTGPQSEGISEEEAENSNQKDDEEV